MPKHWREVCRDKRGVGERYETTRVTFPRLFGTHDREIVEKAALVRVSEARETHTDFTYTHPHKVRTIREEEILIHTLAHACVHDTASLQSRHSR